MDILFQDIPGADLFLLGNEAIVRGAIEAGVGFVSTYPGTPASEIGDTFYRLSRQSNIYFEYSVNEKVALEMAAGASFSGLRTLCSMKHLGLNMAADPFVTLGYIGAVGGLVIVSAGDPSCHTSPNEQDQRYFAQLANIPFFEPSSPDEAHKMVKEAFEVSEKFQVPVLYRINTRVSHTRGMVTCGSLQERRTKGKFKRDFLRFVPIPSHARLLHEQLVRRMDQVAVYSNSCPFNWLKGNGKLGIAVFGESINYVLDTIQDLGIETKVTVLKLGLGHPLPVNLAKEFFVKVKKVLVVEELEPVVETWLRSLSAEYVGELEFFGKGTGQFSVQGEYNNTRVRNTIAEILQLKLPEQEKITIPDLPGRPPAMCPGCPHRTTFYAIKTVTDSSTVFINDIGCYTLGAAPPMNMADNLVSMGSSIPISSSIASVTGKKSVAFIGDSTFFHSGITGLINAVTNNHNVLIVVMDNRSTAMTGFQPHPGIDSPGTLGSEGHVSIEKIVKACGVNKVYTVDPSDLKTTYDSVHKAYNADGVNVVISVQACPISVSRQTGSTLRKAVFSIDHDICKTCGHQGPSLHCGLETCKQNEMNRSVQKMLNGIFGAKGETIKLQPKYKHAPCTVHCPVNICIDGFISKISTGNYMDAMKIIMKRLPFPSLCARVCHRPCEKVCVRNQHDEPVSIALLRRFVTDLDNGKLYKMIIDEKKSSIVAKNRKVAVIGSGPAGLSAAYELAIRGYDATVFESEPEAGGILAWGIPAYRLPKNILEREIQGLVRLGVRIKTSAEIGKDIKLDELFNNGYEAIFLGIGAREGVKPSLDGESLEGVIDALEFLKLIHYGQLKTVAENVAVIGGGDAAIDAARSAKRLGAKNVKIIYRRSLEEMPAQKEELLGATEEGVEIHYMVTPVKFHGENNHVTKMELLKTRMGEIDNSGRPRPVPVQGSNHTIPVDLVVLAIGQQVDLKLFDGKSAPTLTRKNTITVDKLTGATTIPAIFAGGDAVTGPSTVLNAIAMGMKAAHGIDLYLTGDKEKVVPMEFISLSNIANKPLVFPDNYPSSKAVKPRYLSLSKRKTGFNEINKGFSESLALKESERCLQCGTCSTCNHCMDHFGCPAFYIENGKPSINPTLCIGCGICAEICPNGAIYLEETLS